MIRECYENAWSHSKDQSSEYRMDEAGWISHKHQAIIAATHLTRRGETPPSIEVLLASRWPLLDVIYSVLGADFLATCMSSVSIDKSDDKRTRECLQKLVDVMHNKYCNLAGAAVPHPVKQRASTSSTIGTNKKTKLGAALRMALEDKNVTLDADSPLVVHKRRILYPGYSFVDNKRYFHPEYEVFNELFQSLNTRTIEPIVEYLECTRTRREHLLTIFSDAIGRYNKAGTKTKASMSFDEELPAEVVTLKPESICYIYVMTLSTLPFSAGLADIHDVKAFIKVPSAAGSTQKVCVCPWCGMASGNQACQASYMRQEHYGILCLCGVCHEYGNFRIDYLLDHVRNIHNNEFQQS